MSGALIKIDEAVITSAVASVDLGGVNWDDSYDVYKLVWSNLQVDTDIRGIHFRVLDTSNNPITTANYDVAQRVMRQDTTYEASYANGQTIGYLVDNYLGTAAGEVANGENYLFNWNETTDFSSWTTCTVYQNNTGVLRSMNGGGVLDLTAAHKGVRVFLLAGGNLSGGTITLYGLRK